MPGNRNEPTNLSPAEREIMEIVWQAGEVTVADVRQRLGSSRNVARNTVRTLLERMEDKGWLKHRQQGRAFIYLAARPKNVSIGQKVREIVETICGGSPELLVNALLDYRGLSTGELERIRELLKHAERKTKPKKGAK